MLQDFKCLCLVPKPTFLAWAGPIGMTILGNLAVKEIILNLCSDQAEMPYLVLLFRSTGRCSKACSNQKPNFFQTRGPSQHHKVSTISRVAGRSGACASSSTSQSSNSKEASAPAKDRSQGGKCKSCCKMHPASITQCKWWRGGLVVFCRKSCHVHRCWNNFVCYSHQGIKMQESLEREPYSAFLFVSPFSCFSSGLSKPCQDVIFFYHSLYFWPWVLCSVKVWGSFFITSVSCVLSCFSCTPCNGIQPFSLNSGVYSRVLILKNIKL